MPYAAVNGLDMYYEMHGVGPPLMLLHGGSGSIPTKWIPHFAPHYRVIAIEQMGHGRTADAPERSSGRAGSCFRSGRALPRHAAQLDR